MLELQALRRPKMILFDYGQTLCTEAGFDHLAGTRAVLNLAEAVPTGVTAEAVAAFARVMDNEVGRRPLEPEADLLEVYNPSFQRYLYEYFGVRLRVPPEEAEQAFWDAAAPAGPTEHIVPLLQELRRMGIRAGVVSNLSYTGETLRRRICSCMSAEFFEFLMASSDYVYRKPHRRIYELALRKAGLPAQEVWFCGDNAVCDVDGPAALGIMPVWYVGAMHNPHCKRLSPKADCLKIGDWNELSALLQRLH